MIGLPWNIGFVLGAIVAPPDAVAPLSVARRLQLPRRLLVILEGEGLANDATALILYRFAVVAVTGAFSLGKAAETFAIIVVGEIVWRRYRLADARVRRWVRDPRIEITLSILTPFLAYWPPEYLGGSGVLATVAAGLYISWNGLRLISAATRLQGIFFWDLFIYLIEGMVFLVTGLQARTLTAGIHGYSLHDLVMSALIGVRSLSWRGSCGCIRPLTCRAGCRRHSRDAILRHRGSFRLHWRSPACAASCPSPRLSRYRSRSRVVRRFPIAT